MILKGHSKFFSLISNPILTTKIVNLWKKIKRSKFQLILGGMGVRTYQKKLGDLGVGENFLEGVEDSTIWGIYNI